MKFKVNTFGPYECTIVEATMDWLKHPHKEIWMFMKG